MGRGSTVDEVLGALLDRIGSGQLQPGDKLPSCRALAAELGSNPTTVNRALSRLAASGLVEIETRRGSFIAESRPTPTSAEAQIRPMLEQVVDRALLVGLSRERLAELIDEVLAPSGVAPRLAFVECNPVDLEEMGHLAEAAIGRSFDLVPLHDLTPDRAAKYDAIATPIFHLADVYSALGDLDNVIELSFVPTSTSLRQLASIDPSLVVGVATPVPRGIERLMLLTQQYFNGEVRGILTGKGPVDLSDIDVLVYTSATDLTPEEMGQVDRKVKVSWDLEPGSAAGFVDRLGTRSP